jgi:hypothetical protein
MKAIGVKILFVIIIGGNDLRRDRIRFNFCRNSELVELGRIFAEILPKSAYP